MRLHTILLAVIGLAIGQRFYAQSSSDTFFANQLGYHPSTPKVLVIGDRDSAIEVRDGGGRVVASVQPTATLDWSEQAGMRARTVDVSAVAAVGDYTVWQGGEQIGAFRVLARPYAELLPAAVKSYYFQRASTAIPETFGGVYARPAGHPDTAVLFHQTAGRAEQAPVASPGGWYDAGDYNKYVVNGAFSVGIMLQLLERYPDLLQDGAIAFPESGNSRNDLLDELKYELDWMLTMQDPSDGGVHHKLTTERFEPMVMPHEATAQRYILAKSTTATLDFSACFAIAARVFAKAGEAAFAKTCLDAAETAYAWAMRNPAVAFKNPAGVSTGEYGDDDARDEAIWATTELWLTTGQASYARPLFNERVKVRFVAGENWTGYMANLAAFSIALHGDSLVTGDMALFAELPADMRAKVVAVADELITKADTTAFYSPVTDWHWGSTSDVLGAAMFALEAARITGDRKYADAAERWISLVLGCNATGYSWVTGFGTRTAQDIHHRPSAADGVDEPVPGFAIGGPNSRQQDTTNGAVYPVPPGKYPMRSYTDQEGSYASNEVCLNWNAPLVYVLGVLDELHRTSP